MSANTALCAWGLGNHGGCCARCENLLFTATKCPDRTRSHAPVRGIRVVHCQEVAENSSELVESLPRVGHNRDFWHL
jgi:hypothetical protein